MVLNNRGQAMFVSLMLGVIFFIMGLALASPLNSVVSESLLQLNCTTNYLTNSSIDNQTKAICTQIDMFLPLFIGTLFGLGGALIGYLGVK